MRPVKLHIYPRLPGRRDMGFARLAGAGLGNCFFTYFHAYRLAIEQGARLVAPAWRAVRIGPLLRGERTRRHYARELRRHPDEVGGLFRYWMLMRHRTRIADALVDRMDSLGPFARVEAAHFTFVGLHRHREAIRARLLTIMRRPPATPLWGTGAYIAAHVRLGDFAVAQPGDLEGGQRHNLRIPLSWYAHVIDMVRRLYPELPVRIYSDGRAEDLAELLMLEGVALHAELGDVDDLLALAGARILIGSESTFSRWAAFLGDMPSIWFRSATAREQPSDRPTPIAYIGLDDQTLPGSFA